MKKLFTLFLALCAAFMLAQAQDSWYTFGIQTETGGEPFQQRWEYGCIQMIYDASELGNMFGRISAISFHKVQGAADARNVDIYICSTNQIRFPSLNSVIPLSDMTRVFSGNIAMGEGDRWININFSTPYEYTDQRNLAITIIDKTGTVNDAYPTCLFAEFSTSRNATLAGLSWEQQITPDNITQSKNSNKLLPYLPVIKIKAHQYEKYGIEVYNDDKSTWEAAHSGNNGVFTHALKSGSMQYNPQTHTLRMENVVIDDGDNTMYLNCQNAYKDITIELVGENTVEGWLALPFNGNSIITGAGSLYCRVLDKDDYHSDRTQPNYVLIDSTTVYIDSRKEYRAAVSTTVDNFIIRKSHFYAQADEAQIFEPEDEYNYAFVAVKHVELEGCHIVAPQDAFFANDGCLFAGGAQASYVSIEPDPEEANPSEPDGLENISGVSAQKIFRNGQIYIFRNGIRYNIVGTVIR